MALVRCPWSRAQALLKIGSSSIGLGRFVVEVAHRVLAYGTVAAVAVGFVWSLALAVRGRPGARVFDRYQFLIVGIGLVAAMAGAALLASGSRPRDDLHLLYAALAIGIIPLARSFLGGQDSRRPAFIVLAFVVLGGVLYRLLTTG